MILEFMTLT